MTQMVQAGRVARGLLARGALVLSLSAAVVAWGPSDASSQALEGGLLGAGAGAIIGGAIGGGRGAGSGAIIGGATGAIIGAGEAERRRSYGPPPRRVYAPHDGLVYETQVSLSRLGYNPGPVDGVYGGMTGDAIADYQYDHGMRVTGEPSERLLRHMVRRGG